MFAASFRGDSITELAGSTAASLQYVIDGGQAWRARELLVCVVGRLLHQHIGLQQLPFDDVVDVDVPTFIMLPFGSSCACGAPGTFCTR